MRSLRGRLMVWLLVGMGLLLAAGGLALNSILGSQLHRDYDAALIAKARSLETLTEERGDKVWLEFSDKIMPEFEQRQNPDYFQLWLRHGPALERSRSLGTRDLPRWRGPMDKPLLRDLTLPDGRHGRQVEISYQPRSEELEEEEEKAGNPGSGADISGDGPRVTLAVAHSREDLDALLASVQWALILVVLGLLGGTALLVKTVIGVGLVPLDRLAQRLESMGTESLGERLAVADAPSELAPMIRHLNGLLARLQESFARERAFSANLAHELRTPLAELRAVTDVALKWPEDPASWTASCAEIRDIGLQMETLVANLLALARSETKGQASEVPLRELAASCWAAVSPEAAAKGMAFQLEVPDGLTIVADREKLALVLSNLFANAVAYGCPGSPVTCSAAAAGDGFALGVRNATADLAPEDLPRLFDRFWRKDAARSDGRHTGLGLALVAALCESLQLQQEARLDGGWFEILLRGRASSSFLHPGGASLAPAGGRSSGFLIKEAT